MTLARKIGFGHLALIVGLLLLGAASIVALLEVLGNVRVIMKEYAELRMIEDTVFHVSTANIGILRDDQTPAQFELDVREAIAALETFRDAHLSEDGDLNAHDASEMETIKYSMNRLTRMHGETAADRFPKTSEELRKWVDDLDSVLTRVSVLAREADELVHTMQKDADEAVTAALLTVAVLFGVIVVGSIAIGIKQYRSIIGPLGRLRAGVRRIAAGEFSERLGTIGDREFNELADDFNRMTSELQELYENLEKKVAQTSRELVTSERLASVGYLAAGVAHEINNPLNIISGFAELSLRNMRERSGNAEAFAVTNDIASTDATKADVVRTLKIIRDEAFRCKEITGRLLSLSRPGGGRRLPVSVADLLQSVSELVAGHHVSEGRRVEVDVNGDALLVTGDETEVKQVLLNLTVNALQAVSSDVGVVELHATRRGSGVDVIVSDNGRGMTSEIIERVFEPFYTLGAPGGTRGTGLGLSISRAIIESHGGRIRAESDGLGHGSRFIITLPALAESSARRLETPLRSV